MKRRMFFLSLLTLLLVLGSLVHAGWLYARHGRSSRCAVLNADSLRGAHDPLVSSSAQRWRQGLPSHWRAYLLQR